MEKRQIYVRPEAELLVVFFEQDFLGPWYNKDGAETPDDQGEFGFFE